MIDGFVVGGPWEGHWMLCSAAGSFFTAPDGYQYRSRWVLMPEKATVFWAPVDEPADGVGEKIRAWSVLSWVVDFLFGCLGGGGARKRVSQGWKWVSHE